MPSILRAISPASSGLLASFTPPPFPRPPAWICAFTTHTGLFASSSRAARVASSAVFASFPRGTATPNPRRISLAWYSWIFMARLPPLSGRSYTPTPARASDGSLVQSLTQGVRLAHPDPRGGAGGTAQGARSVLDRHPRDEVPRGGGTGKG